MQSEKMDTILGVISDNKENNDKIIREAARILKEGGLVAFPTETVYGLGGDAFDGTAAGRIYAAKGRPSDNPLIVHISKVEDLYQLSDEVSDTALVLAEHFWPGPLTMILPKNSKVPYSVTGGLDTVAIRLPSHEVARQLIAESGVFVAAPSANLSGRPSPTTAAHVIEDLSGRIDMIIDGGAIEIGLESTIVDLTEDVPVILRPGYITIEMLKEVVGEVRLDPALMSGVKGDVKPKAPGMKYRHYAPKAELTILSGRAEDVAATMRKMYEENASKGLRVGIMASSQICREYSGELIKDIGDRRDEKALAHNLFAALRSFDDLEADMILAEGFSEAGMGQALMNRMLKAAGHRIIDCSANEEI